MVWGPELSERRMARSYYEVFEVTPAGGEDEVSSQVSWESYGSQWNGWDRSGSWSSPWHRSNYGWGGHSDYSGRWRFWRNENWTWNHGPGSDWSSSSGVGRGVNWFEGPQQVSGGSSEMMGSSEPNGMRGNQGQGGHMAAHGVPQGDRAVHMDQVGAGGDQVSHGESVGHDQAGFRGQEGGSFSFCAPPAGFDRHGNPPSGLTSAAGDGGGPREPGSDLTESNQPKGKPSSSYPPIFRAKQGESYQDWKRAVSFWLGGEGGQIPVSLIGPRIMVQLRDRAAQLVRHLENSDVNGVGGMALIFKTLEKSPLVKQLDKHRVDQHRRRLMSLCRVSGESLESYVTRGSIYRTQLLSLDKSLEMGERFYIGHLLDHARLTKRDKAMIRTRAGVETEESITTAMIELAAELEGEHGFPIGQSEPNMAGTNGEEFLIQRTSTFGQKRPGIRGALAAGLEVDTPMEEADGMSASADPGDESFDEDVPPEVFEVEKEASALQYKARQRMAEAKKLRNYYKKPDPEERKRAIAEKMKVTHCHLCGELGHWSKECPKRGQQAFVTANGSTTSGRRNGGMSVIPECGHDLERDKEWDLLVSLCTGEPVNSGSEKSAYMVRAGVHHVPVEETRDLGEGEADSGHEVMWNIQELANAVILDLGCMKSVAGTRWANNVVQQWQQKGRWFKVIPEKEVFRFGSGHVLESKFAISFVATFAKKPVILSFSVVSGECPPLLSRPACTQLGVIFDCGLHSMSSRKLKVKNYGLKQTSGGHYAMSIDEFEELDHLPNPPEDFILSEGVEAIIWEEDGAEAHHVCVAGFSLSGSSSEGEELSHVSRVPDSPEAMSCVRRLGTSSPGLLPSEQRRRRQELEHELRCGSLCTEGSEGWDPGYQGDGSLRKEGQGQVGCGAVRITAEGTSTSSGLECATRAGALCDWGGRGHHDGGIRIDSEASSQERGYQSQDGIQEGSDGGGGALSFSVKSMESGCGVQCGGMHQGEVGHFLMEEDALADARERCSHGHGEGSSVATQSAVVGEDVCQGDRVSVRALQRSTEAVGQSSNLGTDVKGDLNYDPVLEQALEYVKKKEAAEIEGEQSDAVMAGVSSADGKIEYEAEKETGILQRPQRGLSQHMKRRIASALASMMLLTQVARCGTNFKVLEIFAGEAMVTRMASQLEGWGAYEPVDILLGGTEHDLKMKENRERLKKRIEILEPDLVVITPPCGPWCLWQNQAPDFEKVEEKRRQHLPFWKFTNEVWELQTKNHRLALTEQPSTSEALSLRYMTERSQVHRVVIDQCQFGLADPISQKLFRKTTALDINEEHFAEKLAQVKRCDHQPAEHEQVKGHVKWQGKWWKRSELAGRWPKKLAQHVLQAAEAALQRPAEDEREAWKLHQHVGGAQWFTAAVEGMVTPEEALRQQLQKVGAEGERFDFVTFEGSARALPRKLRSMLAHLHVTLGHLSNERLVRMLSLAGGNKQLLQGAQQLRCQVCCMVRPPQSRPQVSYQKPSNFNQKVSGDCFHVWDIHNLRYSVVHFIDELTDYQIGDVSFDPTSAWTAAVLRDRWYSVFGPPDLLLTDGGMEFQGSMVRLNEMCGVQHDIIPDQAKWRLGHAERHGAIVKLLMMKMIVALRIDSLAEMQMVANVCTSCQEQIGGRLRGVTFAGSHRQKFQHPRGHHVSAHVRQNQVQDERALGAR